MALNGTASLFVGSPKKKCHFENDVVRLCKCDAALGWVDGALRCCSCSGLYTRVCVSETVQRLRSLMFVRYIDVGGHGVLPASDPAGTGAKVWSSHVTAQRGLLDAEMIQC